MKNYVSLERAKSYDKDSLIDIAMKKFNKQNVDKNGNYVKYSDQNKTLTVILKCMKVFNS